MPEPTIAKWEEIPGKTVRSIQENWDGSVGVLFTDGTVLILAPSEGCEGEPRIERVVSIHDLQRGYLAFVRDLGAISKAEYHQINNARLERQRADREAQDQEMYERLRARFDPNYVAPKPKLRGDGGDMMRELG